VSAQSLSLPPLAGVPDAELGTALPELRAPVPGPRGQQWVDLLARHECPGITARRARRAESSGLDQDPIVWERALGSNVWDPDGNRFVDLGGGFGVACAGHANPAVVAAAHDQLERLVHGLGDAYPARVRIELAAALADLTPGDLQQVIFASSGSEAVEAALKTAVLATGRSGILAFEGGYHGMSLGVLSASHYREGFRAPFDGLLGGYAQWLPFAATQQQLREFLAAQDELPAAILVEPIQGRGGNRCAPAGWLGGLRSLCDELGMLLIFDEIFTGFGRAGSLFQSGSAEADSVVPDLLCLGKGMSSGFPISACIGTEAVMAGWGMSRGEAIHTSTFLGHPVGCAASLAVIELFTAGGLLERGQELGRTMAQSLAALAARHPGRLGPVRGRGAMLGLGVQPAGDSMVLCRRMLQRGYLVLPAGLRGEVLSFTPALTMTHAQWEGALAALEDSL
jgi:4-aminobutyrate aminotransferase-like enzyme